MVKSKEEILEHIKSSLGENPDDASISFLEDVTDTLDDYETKVSDKEDWKTKYEENDKEWRKKYTDRFFANPDGNDGGENPKPAEPEDKKTPMSFEDLFIEVK